MLTSLGQGDDVIHFEWNIGASAVGAGRIVGSKDRAPLLHRDGTAALKRSAKVLPIEILEAALWSRVSRLSHALIVFSLLLENCFPICGIELPTCRCRRGRIFRSPLRHTGARCRSRFFWMPRAPAPVCFDAHAAARSRQGPKPRNEPCARTRREQTPPFATERSRKSVRNRRMP